MKYAPKEDRYNHIPYNRCGKSGLMLPAISLGLWQNFGEDAAEAKMEKIIHHAFDIGITHFDLANNYGPPAGAAEKNLGKILKKSLGRYRDEIIISSKAGYTCWPGPYGDWGSKKYIIASAEQSLKRLGIDYFDIFYSHRPDPNTPIEETMGALQQLVQSGKALYVGISNYKADQAAYAIDVLAQMGVHCLIHQPRYNMFDRWLEDGLLDVLENKGVGCIVFSPLAQGLLTDKYLNGIPKSSRAHRKLGNGALEEKAITEEKIAKVKQLNEIAQGRGQSLAQMAISWLMKDRRITSVLVGASSVKQLNENIAAASLAAFSDTELQQIEAILR